MQSRMEDQVIVLTGGGSGIGKATALLCAEKLGARLAVLDVNEAAARERFRPRRIENDREKKGDSLWIGGYSLQACWVPALPQPSVLRCHARLKRWLQSRHGAYPPRPVSPILMLPMSSMLRMHSMLRMQRPPPQIRRGKMTSNS